MNFSDNFYFDVDNNLADETSTLNGKAILQTSLYLKYEYGRDFHRKKLLSGSEIIHYKIIELHF